MRDAGAREVTVLNCLDSILMNYEQSKEWQMLWIITGDAGRIAPRIFASRFRQAFVKLLNCNNATIIIQP